MFGNKGFGVKLAAALAAVAVLGVASAQRFELAQPPLYKILLQADRLEGRVVRISRVRVVASDAEGFEIAAAAARVRVTPAAPVLPGDEIELTARVQAGGPALRLESWRKPPQGWLARNGGLLSLILTLLAILHFLRHFAWRPSAARVEGAGK